jgi:predicted AlkP superfamily pyrophosphatase or phosphodiesterase
MATILLMVDGLRPDAIGKANCPRLKELMSRSAYTLSASSVMPSMTLPCHMSIFHSVPPERHGVTTNDWQPMARPLPGLVDKAKEAGKRSAFFTNWEPLRDLSRPASLSFSYFRDNGYTDPYGDKVIATEAARFIMVEEPDFAFVYLGTVDIYGHAYGWMSDAYLAQIGLVDAAIGVLLDHLGDQDTVLLQADHGGHKRNHGTDLPEDMLIPWMIAGPGIRAGYEIRGPVSLLDTAPTLAKIMGVKPHREWEGQVVAEVFEGGALGGQLT